MERRRVGIFGGTFDPVHLGHLIIASEIRFALALERVLFVPAAQPPHKPERMVTADHHRLAMLELAIAGNPDFGISRVELERSGPSYTVDTLEILNRQLAPAGLVLLMGADSLRDLPTWREPGRIAERAELAVAQRPGVEVDLDAVYEAIPEARGRIHLVDIPLIGISSSDIRRRVQEGRPIRFHVPTAVERYIVEHGLYRTQEA